MSRPSDPSRSTAGVCTRHRSDTPMSGTCVLCATRFRRFLSPSHPPDTDARGPSGPPSRPRRRHDASSSGKPMPSPSNSTALPIAPGTTRRLSSAAACRAPRACVPHALHNSGSRRAAAHREKTLGCPTSVQIRSAEPVVGRSLPSVVRSARRSACCRLAREPRSRSADRCLPGAMSRVRTQTT